MKKDKEFLENLRTKTAGELISMRDEQLDLLFRTKLDLGMGKQQNVRAMKKIRKTVAQINTVLRMLETKAENS